ncbi:hypothetical protein GBA52_023263 [Prunus armeniaca]|nr:hypothetical protein GBA52_023263 [Prunus armeniaca]
MSFPAPNHTENENAEPSASSSSPSSMVVAAAHGGLFWKRDNNLISTYSRRKVFQKRLSSS